MARFSDSSWKRLRRAAGGAVVFCLGMILIAGYWVGCQATAVAPIETAAVSEPGYWPMAIDTTAGRVEIYQPQPLALSNGRLQATSAVSLQRPGDGMTFGAIWFTADLETDRDTRFVKLRDVNVTNAELADASPAEQQGFSQIISSGLSGADMTFPMDQLMASLDTAAATSTSSPPLNNTPPQIIFSDVPATLISINGEPKMLPMEGYPNVSRVANTPFIILLDQAQNRYYLKAGTRWVTASDVQGAWTDAAQVPPQVEAVGTLLATPAPASTSTTQPATQPQMAPEALHPTTQPELSAAAANAKIIVVTRPSELIVTTGAPQFTAVEGAGGELMYASNTDADLFLDQTQQKYYVLLAGRWYTAPALQGPWQYVRSDSLPPSFAQIPPDSPKGNVLTFVAGTTEAREGVLEASVPQTADISRTAGADFSVAYDGEPRFQESGAPGTTYAVNTPEEVFQVNGAYYCCHQGVWYVAPAPVGPWQICTAVPGQIYTVPPSCPDYNATYVYVYDVEPDYVTFGYLPGYTGTYVNGPTICYGTGYEYPGWFGTTYFPPPLTWGFGAAYDPFLGAWAFDVGLFWDGGNWFCHPWHERWWASHPHEEWGWHRWWGPGGFNHAGHVRENFVAARRSGAFRHQNGAALRARMPGEARGGTGWEDLYHRDGNARRLAPETAVRAGHRAGHVAHPVTRAQGTRGNVFAGNNGNVFRRSPSGWEANHGRTWTGVKRAPLSTPTFRPPRVQRLGGAFVRPEGGLEQHFAARTRGTFRSGIVHGFEGGHNMSLGRPGGAFHGGGGFHGGEGGGGFHRGGGHGGGRR